MPFRCGLLGTITSDTIEADDGRTRQSIGGILYQAAALCGLGVPSVLFSNCGEFLRPDVEAIVGEWPILDCGGLKFVPGPGNRVRLRYSDQFREREEVLESAVPPLDPGPVLNSLEGLDFLFLVFNSGFDISLADWRNIAGRARCPIWIDIHSLALTPGVGVRRAYRAVPEWREWVKGAAFLQANRQEVACLMGHPERWADESEIKTLAAQAFDLGLRAIFMTMGKEGVLAATPGRIFLIPAPVADAVVDTTGCGDVFAAASAAGLLQGFPVARAASAGVELATRAVSVSGLRETYRLASRAMTDDFFRRFGGKDGSS